MPFNYLLTNLLVDVPAAVGAIFLDEEGEAVEWVTRHGDPFELKLEGAYHAIFRRRLEACTGVLASGSLESYTLAGERLTALTRVLPGGYYVVLVIDNGGSRARASYHLERTGRILARELA
jgi:hypothetical protein